MQAPEADVLVLLEALLLSLKGRFDLALGPGSTGTPPLARFRPLLQQLLRSPARVLGLADAASLRGLSPAYFAQCFKAAFGTSPSAHRRLARSRARAT